MFARQYGGRMLRITPTPTCATIICIEMLRDSLHTADMNTLVYDIACSKREPSATGVPPKRVHDFAHPCRL
ncbi:hypothetical protein EVAR_33684_1 [Eumeta japonica]|uniref:Uncharacterized protein n=1 Tax=Eumeta variegata TaxID=151549 RepID=A0A4C1VLW2_EUMVA|nr:hypothetical protein EVAR_33684_1 [Eumeta japonica]